MLSCNTYCTRHHSSSTFGFGRARSNTGNGGLGDALGRQSTARSRSIILSEREFGVNYQGSHSARTPHCMGALFSLRRVPCVWYRSTTGRTAC